MDYLRGIITDILRRLDALERNITIKKYSVPSDGFFVPKVLSSDPGTPQVNEIWINSTTKALSWNDSGTIRRVTLS